MFLAANDLFDRFGAPVVFVSALIEATVGLGLIYPGVILMFLGGAFADDQGTPIGLIWVLAILGTMLGDTISYALGRWGGGRLERSRFGKQLRIGRMIVGGKALWLIPFYHLNSWTRTLGPFGAGAIGMPLRIWMPLDYLGAIIANSAWVGAGYFLGQAVLTPEGKLDEHPALRIGLGLGAAIWFVVAQREFLKSYRKAMLEERESAGTPEPATTAAEPSPEA